ncbi:MAG TPA: hypothetical protein VJI33_01635 [Candidatus Paceibacterota bacterium]
MIETWSQVLQTSFNNLWVGVVEFIPKLVVALVIFLVGWGIGVLLDKVIAQIVGSIKVDNVLKRAKLDELLKRAGFNLDSGRFLGGLVKWFVIVVFLVASLDVLGLNQVTMFLQQVVMYIPQVIVAALVILAAALIAEAVQRLVVGGAAAAGISSASFAGAIAKWAIWVFAILIALSQLGIAAPFVQTLFTGIVVAVALALGLSFGLGGQEAASSLISKVKSEIAARHHSN